MVRSSLPLEENHALSIRSGFRLSTSALSDTRHMRVNLLSQAFTLPVRHQPRSLIARPLRGSPFVPPRFSVRHTLPGGSSGASFGFVLWALLLRCSRIQSVRFTNVSRHWVCSSGVIRSQSTIALPSRSPHNALLPRPIARKYGGHVMDVPPISTSAPVVCATPRRNRQVTLQHPACSKCSCRRASLAIWGTRGSAQPASCHLFLRKYHCALVSVQGASG